MRLTRWEVISMAIAIGGDAAVPRSMIVRTCRGGSCEVTEGMEVVGADGVHVGRVRAVDRTCVLVDRALRRDVFVPFEAITGVAHGALVLNIPGEQIAAMHWPHPPLV